MKNNVVKVIVILFVLITIGVCGFVFFDKKEEEPVVNYVKGDLSNIVLAQVNDQKAINEELQKKLEDKKYTFDNPYVELNPYKLSPLSAIILFQTDKEEEIDVYINEEFVTKMESTRMHSIPVFGLLEDHNNIVKLVGSNSTKTIEIKTEKSNLKYPMTVEEASDKLDKKELYFTVASLSTYLNGWDIDGNLRFYLTADNRMDVEWLENGHFLIGVTQDQTREQFVGFVEMDFMGKIYNYYTLENGYSFEFQILSNGNYMMAGGEQAIYMDHQVVHEINPKDGKRVSYIDIYDVVKAIDPDFESKWLGAAAIRNGFYYDESIGELVVSFREINTIFSFDYKTKKLNYVFTNPDNELFAKDVWKDYLVTIEGKKGRYPLGQHTPTITKEGYLAVFNNGYDRYTTFHKGGSDLVSNFKDAYTSMEIFEIKDRKAKLVWSYDRNKDIFSIKYGLFNVLDNGHKLIDYGYILSDEFMSNPNNSLKESENSVEGNYAEIIELDEKDKVVFRAKSDEGKFRVFKHTLYNTVTANVELKTLNMYNTIPNDKIEVKNIKDVNLDDAIEWINSVNLTKNTFTSSYAIQEDDNIDFYLVNKDGKIYVMNYKSKDVKKTKRVFNLNLNNDDYRLYIKLNNDLYYTNNVYRFD